MNTLDEFIADASKYSRRTIQHFEETFPCENDILEVKIYDINYHKEIERVIQKIGDSDENTKQYIMMGYEPFDPIYIGYESVEELCARWTRYKKLMAFL
jgi:hypothetical protein